MLPGIGWALAGLPENVVIAGTNAPIQRVAMMPSGEKLLASPFDQFQRWMAEAEKTEPNDPNAMIVATTTLDGHPSLRTVLLKGVDERGFVFYTNKQSRKGDELAANPNISLLFFWKSLGRQIRIEGTIEHVTDAEADAYYASRLRISRLGAWASQQSRPLPNRAVLEERLAEMERRYPDEIPRPAYWSGTGFCPTGSSSGRTCLTVCMTGRFMAGRATAPGIRRNCFRDRRKRGCAMMANPFAYRCVICSGCSLRLLTLAMK